MLKKVFRWYFDLCRQVGVDSRAAERLRPRIWHKDYILLHFINANIRAAIRDYGLSGKSVLDLGCSHKPYEPLFKASEYVGVDYYNSDYAEIKADLNDVQQFGRTFDVVVCFDTLEHILRTDNALQTIARHAKDGGIALITTPFFFALHDAPHDYHRFTEYFYRSIPHSQFRLITLNYASLYPTSLIASVNSMLYRFPFPYFFKYPFYFAVNVWALGCEYMLRPLANRSPVWLKEFLLSGPLEYFAIFRIEKEIT